MSISTKEIQNKIISILNTKKITKAMEMISIIKMRKIEILMKNSVPYLSFIKNIIYNQKKIENNFNNIFFKPTIIKKIIIILISTDRGLCGSLNTNLFKKVINKINFCIKNNIKYKLVIFGNKGFLFFKNFSYKILKYIKNIGNVTNFKKILKIIKKIFYMYENSEIDHVYIASNIFKNKLLQIPKIIQLLPFFKKKKINYKKKSNYLYESNKKKLLKIIFKKYFFTKIYQSYLENISCEHVSRMFAMKNATDNSNNIIHNLKMVFNKVRQFNVTQELNEIVSGASAIL